MFACLLHDKDTLVQDLDWKNFNPFHSALFWNLFSNHSLSAKIQSENQKNTIHLNTTQSKVRIRIRKLFFFSTIKNFTMGWGSNWFGFNFSGMHRLKWIKKFFRWDSDWFCLKSRFGWNSYWFGLNCWFEMDRNGTDSRAIKFNPKLASRIFNKWRNVKNILFNCSN